MSSETHDYLSKNTLIGYTAKRGTAWHYREGDNNHYTGAIPVEDVKTRLFNWEPQVVPLEATLPDGSTVYDSTRKVVIRPDTLTVLGVFKSGYTAHPYSQWLVDNVDTLLDADLQIGSAGLLAGGARAWVQVEMEDTVEQNGVDFRPFLTAATSLDGSIATTYQMGAQVVVCDNTLSLALSASDVTRYRIKHTRNSGYQVDKVREALGLMALTADAVTNRIKALNDVVVTDAQWSAFLDVFAAPSSDSKRALNNANTKRSELAHLYHSDERVAPWAGTAWGVVAAVNTWAHHMQDVRGMTRPERNMDRMVQGQFAKIDADTLTILTKATGVDLSALDLTLAA